MKKIIALIGLACIVSSCTDSSDESVIRMPGKKPPVAVSTTTGASSTGTSTATASGKYLTLNYTLRVDSETGAIQETTLESVAKANNLNKTGATYQPFSVLLGANQVIYGFEQGLIGLKKGDKKVIKVTPEEGYGRPVSIPKERIAPEFTIERSRELFANTVKQTIERSKFPAEMQTAVKNAKVGDTLTGANNATAKVVSADATSLTIEIENKENPFYGKEIKVGQVATIPASEGSKGAIVTIEKVSDKTVTISVVNKDSPFYGKKFAVGESITQPTGGKVTIKEIGDTTVSILADHPLMNKTLYFDVEIVDVQ